MRALVSVPARYNAELIMIIACPACGTRYAVPKSAIGAGGRTVRCAKCKHSWFQEADLPLPAPAAPPAPPPAAPPPAAASPAPAETVADAPQSPAPQPPEAIAAPSVDHWRAEDTAAVSADADNEPASLAFRALRSGGTQADQPTEDRPSAPDLRDAVDTPDPVMPPARSASRYDDDEEDNEFSQFGYSAPFTRRRNTAKIWTLAAAIFAAMALGTIAAVNYYGLPEWAPFSRPTFGLGKPGLELDFPPEQNRSETLKSGEAIFRVSGAINNNGRETLAVPNLLIVFRDQRDRQVANWVVAPAKRELAPGESLNVTEAIADVPAAAVFVEIGWAP
jgi:predicted Zn finger-like uncharacterized protein